jgi:hypothetical protein
MSSEGIVVLVLIALAVGFVIWIRMNSHDHEPTGQAGNPGEGENTRDRK